MPLSSSNSPSRITSLRSSPRIVRFVGRDVDRLVIGAGRDEDQVTRAGGVDGLLDRGVVVGDRDHRPGRAGDVAVGLGGRGDRRDPTASTMAAATTTAATLLQLTLMAVSSRADGLADVGGRR